MSNTRRRSTNTVGETNLNIGSPGVAAHPVASPAPVGENDIGRLTESLAAASPGFNKFLSAKQRQFEIDETDRAIADANMSKEDFDEAVAKGMLRKEQSPWYQKAFMAQMGQNMASRRSRQIAEEYESSFNKDEDDINEFIASRFGEDLRGLDDLDFKSGYLQKARPAEEAIRNNFSEYQIARVKQQAFDGFSENVFHAAMDAKDRGVALSAGELGVLEDNAREMGIERQQFNDIVVNSLMTLAQQGDGNPAVLEALKRKGTNGIASAYYTGRYGLKLQQAEAHATKLQLAAQAKAQGAERMAFMTDVLSKANDGTDVSQLIASVVQDSETNPNGWMTPEQGASILLRADAAREEAQRKREAAAQDEAAWSIGYTVLTNPAAYTEEGLIKTMDAAGFKAGQKLAILGQWRNSLEQDATQVQMTPVIEGGIPTIAQYLGAGGKTKDVQTAIDMRFNEIKARGGDDQLAIINETMQISEKTGFFPTELKTILQKSVPGTAGFTEGAKLYEALDRAGYGEILQRAAGLPDEQAMAYQMYLNQRYAGSSEESAVEAVTKGMSPTALAVVNQTYYGSSHRRDWQARIANEFRDYENSGSLAFSAESILKQHIGMTGKAPTDDMVSWAIDRVKGTRREVMGTLVQIDPAFDPGENFDDAVKWKLGQMAPELGREADSVRLRWDQGAQVWKLLDKENFYPIVGPKNVPLAFDGHTVVAEYLVDEGNRTRAEAQAELKRQETLRKQAQPYHEALDKSFLSVFKNPNQSMATGAATAVVKRNSAIKDFEENALIMQTYERRKRKEREANQ
jgi:hypothetical protein